MQLLPAFITIVPMLPIFQWGAVVLFPKELAKVAAGAETTLIGNLGDGLVGLAKHLTGDLEPITAEVGGRAGVQLVMEQAIAGALADVTGGGKFFDGDGLGIMLVKIDHQGFDLPVLRFGMGVLQPWLSLRKQCQPDVCQQLP